MNNIKQIRNRSLRDAHPGDNIDFSSKIKYLKLLNTICLLNLLIPCLPGIIVSNMHSNEVILYF